MLSYLIPTEIKRFIVSFVLFTCFLLLGYFNQN